MPVRERRKRERERERAVQVTLSYLAFNWFIVVDKHGLFTTYVQANEGIAQSSFSSGNFVMKIIQYPVMTA